MAFYTLHSQRLTSSICLGIKFNTITSQGRRYKVAKCRSDFSAGCNSQPLSTSTFHYHTNTWPESTVDHWVSVYYFFYGPFILAAEWKLEWATKRQADNPSLIFR